MKEYIVKSGDSLWKIANRNGTTVAILAHLNHLKGKQLHSLKIGQHLRLPGDDVTTPDSFLTLKFRGLDFAEFTPKKVKVECDGKSTEHDMTLLKSLAVTVSDHAQGLKVWIEDIDKKMVQVMDEARLPFGKWDVAIDSRKVQIAGNLLLKKGKAESTTEDVKKTVTQNAQAGSGQTAQEQIRTEQGTPVHALATIYTSENLRLLPGNEQFRALVIAAAKKHDLTPQSLAALIDAEAAKKLDGTWLENSNASNPSAAQGLAQFFEAGWTDVFNSSDSLLNKDCANLAPSARLSKRLEAKYAIDGAATYAKLNLKNFAKQSGYPVDALSAEDKAKLAYLLHHEGLTGAKRLFGLEKGLDDQSARSRLAGQLGKKNTEKLESIIAQYDGDAVAAYKGWLFDYTDKKINVSNYLVQDAQKFAAAPRTMSAIASGLSSAPAVPPPKPKPAAPPKPKPKPATPSAPAVKPASSQQHPATAPATPVTGSAAANSQSQASAASPSGAQSENNEAAWFDPLSTCTLRTAHLASKKAATFGKTRNGGKRNHQGIDLVAVPGTPIFAVASGTVYMAKGVDYGKTLLLEVGINDLPPAQAAHFRAVNPGRKTIGFFYAHLNEYAFTDTTKPVHVMAGEVLGKTGSTGNAKGMDTVAAGAHLHFEARQNALLRCAGLTNRVDPLPFIQNCTNP
jgi:murein DD-endopeptidase MepM/ murein hydrolase activator NlpD